MIVLFCKRKMQGSLGGVYFYDMQDCNTLILVENQNFCQKADFAQKSKIWLNIKFLVKNRKFGQKLKSKLWFKINIVVKNRNFGQKSK